MYDIAGCQMTYKIIFCISDSVISIDYKLTQFYEMCSRPY